MASRGAPLNLTLAILAAIIALGTTGTATVRAGAGPNSAPTDRDGEGFLYRRAGSPPLVNPTRWVLHGTKAADGTCSYRYPRIDRAIPENGWVLRSIGINPSNCTKLMEEGSPESPMELSALADGGTQVSESLDTIWNPKAPKVVTVAASSTRGAFQWVSWLDIASLKTSYDITQIHWTYNGTSVLSGNTEGIWWWLNSTGWTLVANSNVITQRFERMAHSADRPSGRCAIHGSASRYRLPSRTTSTTACMVMRMAQPPFPSPVTQ